LQFTTSWKEDTTVKQWVYLAEVVCHPIVKIYVDGVTQRDGDQKILNGDFECDSIENEDFIYDAATDGIESLDMLVLTACYDENSNLVWEGEKGYRYDRDSHTLVPDEAYRELHRRPRPYSLLWQDHYKAPVLDGEVFVCDDRLTLRRTNDGTLADDDPRLNEICFHECHVPNEIMERIIQAAKARGVLVELIMLEALEAWYARRSRFF
jgi:hypothetical protein